MDAGYFNGDGDYFAITAADTDGAADVSDTDSILLRLLILALSLFVIAESLCSNDLSLMFLIAKCLFEESIQK